MLFLICFNVTFRRFHIYDCFDYIFKFIMVLILLSLIIHISDYFSIFLYIFQFLFSILSFASILMTRVTIRMKYNHEKTCSLINR